MARSQTPAAGHNPKEPLTDQETVALGVHHQLRITAEQRKLDALLVDVANQRKIVNSAFKLMTADLGYTRKDFQGEVIDKLEMTAGEYQAHILKVDRLHRIAGLREGEQLDLLDHLTDTVDESEAAFQDGYRAGRRAADPVPGSHVAAIMHPRWMEGWHAGQAWNGEQLKLAHEIMSRPKPGEMVEADDEDPETDDDDGIDAEVRRLEATGWVEPTEAEAEFEVADNGRTIRRVEEAA